MRTSYLIAAACCCALASAGAQTIGELFPTPTPTPEPTVTPLSVAAAPKVSVHTVAVTPTQSVEMGLVTTPALFESYVAAASNATLVAALSSAATAPTLLGSLLTGASAPARSKVFAAIATLPPVLTASYIEMLSVRGTLAASLDGVQPGTLATLLASLSTAPDAAKSLLGAFSTNNELLSVVAALASATPAQAAADIKMLDASGYLVSTLADASSATILSTATSLTESPETEQTFLKAVQASGQLTATVSYWVANFFNRDVSYLKPIQVDLLTAMVSFASQDDRFTTIAPFSYFGRQLQAVKNKQAVEGHTPENDAAMAKVYGDATAALKSFLAHEKKAPGP